MMTVDNPEVIDAIGIEVATGSTVLNLIDHLEWDLLREHLLLLQDKLNRYLGFLEHDEMRESYPQGLGRPVKIEIHFKHAPPDEAREFLEKAVQVVAEYDCSLTWS